MIKDKIKSKVAKAFNNKLADAVHTFTCNKIIYSGKLDFTTQTYPIVSDDSYSGRGVLFGSYKKDLVKPTDYQIEDSKATVLQNELIKGTSQHKPEIGDKWVTSKGTFKIVNIGADPTDSIWAVQLRKVSG